MYIRKIFLLSLIILIIMTAGLSARSWNIISISKAEDVKLGNDFMLSVDLNEDGFSIGSMNMAIYYDPSAVNFNSAEMGDLLTSCNWEHFEYTTMPCQNCSFEIIRIKAVAEYIDNSESPLCNSGPGQIIKLNFTAGDDPSLNCTHMPVGFYWESCQDNILINNMEDTLWLSDYVIDYDGNDITGTPFLGGSPLDCLDNPEVVPIRFLDFMTGGVSFNCQEYICGDVNGDTKINILDPSYLIVYLFKGGNPPDPLERGDLDCDPMDAVDIGDLVYIIDYIFNLGNPPCCD